MKAPVSEQKVHEESKFTKEITNIWNFVSLLAEMAAAILLLIIALGYTNNLPKLAIAIAGSVIIVNVLAKLYSLSRK